MSGYAETSSTTTAEVRGKVAALSALLAAGILFLVAANGFFTYSGALLYVQEQLYALLFAVAVQFAIAASLLALPYVRGLGKLAMLIVYAAALALSTLSAFLYVYNASLPERTDIHALGTASKALLSNKLSDALQLERARMELQRQELERAGRGVEEEVKLGLSSGLGPGRGPEYYRKVEFYQEVRTRSDLEEKRFEEAQLIIAEITRKLSASDDTTGLREQLIVLFSRLRAEIADPAAQDTLYRVSQEHLGTLLTPIEKAYFAVVDRDQFSISLLVSAIWAAIFDLIALFIGIIRYYLLKPTRPFFQRVYDGLTAFYVFVLRLVNLRSEARARFNHQHAAASPALNSTEMHAFATYLLAGSQLAQLADNDDPVEPLRTLLGYVEPLEIEKPKNSVGIRYEQIESEPRMKALLSMLMQSGVLLSDRDHRCYLLNPSAEVAQKVLVFIRVGMKSQPEQLENFHFMLQDRSAYAAAL
ncbi:MAG: hypothetical protein ACFCUG_12795 [Thiotrichales bacterium]